MVKVTIFGLPGSGTTSLGMELAKTNNLKFKSSGNMFRELAKDLGFELYEFSKLCLNNLEYDRKLDEKIKEYGLNNDDFVFDSRLAWYFIPDSIKIKLESDFEIRIKRISKRDGVDFDFARNKTIEREELEKERYFKLYGIVNLDDDKNFDLIIDTSNLTINQTLKKINFYLKNLNK